MPTIEELVRSVNPDAPDWVVQLARYLHQGGAENDAILAAARANDFTRIPALGQGLEKVTEGLADLREINNVRLTALQMETLRNVFAEMMNDFAHVLENLSKRD